MALSFLVTGNTVTPSNSDWQLLCIAADGANGGGAATDPVTNLALAGASPPNDGSVKTYFVYDTVNGNKYYNRGTVAVPSWVAW